MKDCEHIKQQLTDMLPGDVIPEAIKQHLSGCADCNRYCETLQALNQDLETLPEYDVSDAVFARTLAAVQAAEAPVKDQPNPRSKQPSMKPSRFNPQWATGLAASFVLVAVAGLLYNGSLSEYGADFNQVPHTPEAISREGSPGDQARQSEADAQPAETAFGRGVDALRAEKREASKQLGDELGVELYSVDVDHDDRLASISEKPEVTGARLRRNTSQVSVSGTLDAISQDLPVAAAAPEVLEEELMDVTEEAKKVMSHIVPEQAQDLTDDSLEQLLESINAPNAAPVRYESEAADKEADGVGWYRLNEAKPKPKADSSQFNKPQRPAQSNHLGLEKQRTLKANARNEVGRQAGSGLINQQPLTRAKDRQSANPEAAAIEYLTDLQSTTGLDFKQPSGYWANTYVPGDPNMRWIQSQLLAANGLDLPEVRQNTQPFDASSQSALAVYLNSDHQALAATGPTRLRLQVGIQAGEQQGGQRAVLHTALVLDLSQTSDQAITKALFDAMLKAKQSADQITVFVVGQGQVLEAADFRHGPIQVATAGLHTKPAKPDMGLSQTVQAAQAWLQQHDDPSSALGSSAVWLITDRTLTSTDMQLLETRVHQQALEGITFSTWSLGANTQRKQLQRLAILGQGHSHVLRDVNDAQRVTNEAIKASSRAVARALRLQIRLAEQVQLIDVLGSYALNADQAQQVRDAEQSLDQRLANNLGIQRDRGKDDEGIQVVIPNFYAGDTHVVILDVLVKQPGVVVDVTARYKDLIHLRNAVSRKSLALTAGHNQLGPLQYNVMKNVLIHHVTDGLFAASEQLRAGQIEAAAARLQTLLKLYQAMRRHIPAWHQDAEIKQDELLLKQLLQLIQSQSAIEPDKYRLIADSMSYLSWRKRLTHSP